MILQTLKRAIALVAGPPTGPRARPKAAVWLQLALVCALTACPTSHTDAQEDFMSLVREVCIQRRRMALEERWDGEGRKGGSEEEARKGRV